MFVRLSLGKRGSNAPKPPLSSAQPSGSFGEGPASGFLNEMGGVFFCVFVFLPLNLKAIQKRPVDQFQGLGREPLHF